MLWQADTILVFLLRNPFAHSCYASGRRQIYTSAVAWSGHLIIKWTCHFLKEFARISMKLFSLTDYAMTFAVLKYVGDIVQPWFLLKVMKFMCLLCGTAEVLPMAICPQTNTR
jgi:hypothetical protein